MRLGVIRGDLPGAVSIGDLEQVSRYNPSTEPRGQERYLARPTTAEIEAALAHATTGAGAVIEGSDLTGSFPITINASNDDLKVKTSSGAAFTTVLIAQAAYASITTLLAAVNAALVGTGITARQGTGSGIRVAIESNTKGVNSYISVDSTGGGSVANTPLGFGASAIVRTMPAASAFITALNPVGGTLDVSSTAINAVGATTNSNALSLIPSSRGTQTAVADAIAPRFYETSVAQESYLVGMIAELRSSSFNPDPRRGLPSGAAVSVVQDDGVTAMTLGLPIITLVAMGPTGVTLTGTNMGSFDKKETVVQLTTPQTMGPPVVKRLSQRAIEFAGGSVSATSIVIPSSLAGTVTLATTARVQVRQRVSAAVSINSGDVSLSDTMVVGDSNVIEKNGVVVP